MRHISTLFFCLVLLFSTVCAQEPSSLKDRGLKILNRQQLPFTISNTEPVTFRIRCLASNLNDEPLLIIDGILAEKFELGNINPDNIESIWVLKGHTATALYGCRAATGVILITTKTANDRTIRVKDMLTGEILASVNVDLISMEERKDTIHLITDSSGKIVSNKIGYGKEYELKVSNVGYKNLRCIVSSKQLGKNYTVLLERNYEDLEEVRIKSSVIKQLHRRTHNAYFDSLYGLLRCLGAGIKVNDQINIEDRKNSYNIKLYPNPVLRSQKVNIEIENEKDAKLTVRLFCLDGKMISSSEYQIRKGINKISYSLNGSLIAGLYALQIIDEDSRILKTDKLIIQ